MKRFAVIPNKYKDRDLLISKNIAAELIKGGKTAEVITDDVTPDILCGYDCAVVLGGDGTVLSVAKKAAVNDIPVAGINLGRIGYLSSFELDETGKLLSVDEKDDEAFSRRIMISLEHRGESYDALNDIVIAEKRSTRMISLSVSVDSDKLFEYNSTALIFSTPTGSSGYNMSAGGPVLDPELSSVCVVPVCPHTGATRSFVYSSNVSFTVENTSTPDKSAIISVDGINELPLGIGETVRVTRSPYTVRLVNPDKEPFAKKLVRKMKF